MWFQNKRDALLQIDIKQGVAQWLARLIRKWWKLVKPSKSLIGSKRKKPYPYCIVLVGSSNKFDPDLHIKKDRIAYCVI